MLSKTTFQRLSDNPHRYKYLCWCLQISNVIYNDLLMVRHSKVPFESQSFHFHLTQLQCQILQLQQKNGKFRYNMTFISFIGLLKTLNEVIHQKLTCESYRMEVNIVKSSVSWFLNGQLKAIGRYQPCSQILLLLFSFLLNK